MTVRVGINGFGRIGRNFVRAVLDQGVDIEVVAVNDLTSPETLAHLLRYDSSQGRLGVEVSVHDGGLLVAGKQIAVTSERNPADIAWGELGVDVVVESTGLFTARDDAAQHIAGGMTQRPTTWCRMPRARRTASSRWSRSSMMPSAWCRVS